MPSHKTFRIKKKLAKKMRQNRPIPHWIRMRTDNTISFLKIHLCIQRSLFLGYGIHTRGISFAEDFSASGSLDDQWHGAMWRVSPSFSICFISFSESMMSILKRPLFLVAKFTVLLFLILAPGVTLVIATRQPKSRASSMYSTQSNRPVQPSGPNPCSFLPGSGHCKPLK
ncbi:hypothetical protein POTOM_024290 [Populus tomentosa]|uniref:60S ribosomal protein L39 n=1 Tax=Populus tomentosa TaxID=118781 RepID=A0A8X8D1R1_POPTO|nr:hypothetical protein POTOM_024290 [Populus tomentosa]